MNERKPRILIAIGSLEVGGAERQVVEICRGLRDEFEFHVVTVAAQRGPFEEPLRETGAQHHALRSAPGSSSSSRLIRAWRAALSAVRFRRAVRLVQPDLIHAYLFEMSIAAVAARWPRRAPPLLLSRRSLVQWIAHDPIYFPVARWMNRRADLILANSEAVRRDTVEKERLDPEHVRVIYNGVDAESFPPGPPDDSLYAELGVSRTLPVVGMIANLHSYKGHEEMIEAAALLKNRGVEFTLLFVGREGNASERVAELVRETGSSRIVVAGPRSDVPQAPQVHGRRGVGVTRRGFLELHPGGHVRRQTDRRHGGWGDGGADNRRRHRPPRRAQESRGPVEGDRAPARRRRVEEVPGNRGAAVSARALLARPAAV